MTWLKLLRLMFKGICPYHDQPINQCFGCEADFIDVRRNPKWGGE